MSPHDLLKINVNDHTEKKNGLTYLSWAWAWAEVLKLDPQANYEVLMFPDWENPNHLLPYQHLGNSHMVWVKVTVFGKSMTQQLPILDYRNKCIPEPNAFEVNTSIMRCLTKGIAMHGLGLYIYAGEDLPESDEKDAPAPVVTTTKPEPKADQTLDNSDASRKLFADGMIEYTSTCTTVAGLNSYWKSNQLQLDSLKVTHPDLYQAVLTKFQELKKSFSNGETK